MLKRALGVGKRLEPGRGRAEAGTTPGRVYAGFRICNETDWMKSLAFTRYAAMWGAAECAFSAATLRHFSTTTTTSGRTGGWTARSVGQSTAAPYSRQPSSARTAG